MSTSVANREMTALIDRLAPAEGLTLSSIEGVRLMRSSRMHPRTPVLYEPCIVIVCQGRKIGYLGDRTLPFDPDHFLLLTLPMPFESETVATPELPLLAVSIAIDLGVTAELAHLLELPVPDTPNTADGISSAPLDAPLADSVVRMLRALENPGEARALGAGLLREITYRVLAGPRGDMLRAALARRGAFGQVATALRRIHADYRDNLDVGTLANEAHLSPAAFHVQFKRVTSTSPMQYLKATRLHKARLLMIHDGVSAARAADRVGYESASQFSREFKRLFGRTPVDEIKAMRAAYGSGRSESRDRP